MGRAWPQKPACPAHGPKARGPGLSHTDWGYINKGGELVVRDCKPWLLKITIKEIGFVILLLKFDRNITSIFLFLSLLNSGYHLILLSNSIFASLLFIEVGFTASRIKKGCGCVDIMITIGLVVILIQLRPRILISNSD
jgi:hypothetical protein